MVRSSTRECRTDAARAQSATWCVKESEDPQTREGEVEPDGIVWIERAQTCRGLESHRPTAALPSRPAERPDDPEEMRVERKDKAGRGDPGPYTAVDPVVWSDHPTQEQARPFAGRASCRKRQQPTRSVPMRNDPIARERAPVERKQARAERIERRPQGGGLRIRVALDEKRLERPRPFPDLAHQMEKQCDVPSSGESVNESVEEGGVAGRIERSDESTRVPAEPLEETPEASANRCDTTVGEARGDQPDDLPILRIVELANDSYGIAVEEASVVSTAQILESTQ